MRQLPTNDIPRLSPKDARIRARTPVVVVVENVRSAFNVGSILRTADALLLEHVFLTGYTPAGDHRGVHKSALGAQDVVPWSHQEDVEGTLRALRSRGYTIAAVEITTDSTDPRLVQAHQFPLALVVGNEVTGVSREALTHCQMALELPQFGTKHSLNVAVALGVVGYDVTRRWKELAGGELPASSPDE